MIEDVLNKLLMLDTRLVAYLVWGMGTTLVYGVAAANSYGDFRVQGDRRSRRELIEDVGLFATAIFANLAILMVLFGENGSDPRQFAVAVALGAFLGVGIVKATARRGRA